MRAVWIPRHGGANVLEVRETPDPIPSEGEIRIRVRACGLNFAEVMARQGLYPDSPKPPLVAGYEASGVVDAVGAEAHGFEKGTRAVALTRFGGHADTVCVPAEQALVMPERMTFDEGAALPVNYLTAYHMLFEVFRIKPGDRVLVHMAAGGVGTAVCQLCKTVPDVVTYGTASRHKHEYIRDHGCTHPIDYHRLDYVRSVRDLTEGRGVDLVLDPLGGADWKRGYSLLRPGGQLIAFGWANMTSGGRRRYARVLRQLSQTPIYSPTRLMNDNRGVSGVNMGHLWQQIDLLGAEMAALRELYEKDQIKPHVDRSFSFEDAAEAHRYIESRENVGKVLLTP